MAQVNFHNIRVAGVAGAIPSQCIDNRMFSSIYGEEQTDKIIESIGIRQHYKAHRRQTAGDLAYGACKHLLEQKGVCSGEIGALIFLTTTPDYMVPSTAYVLHKRLDLPQDCLAFDINLSCSAYVYALQIAGSLLQGMQKKYILIANGHAPKHLDIQNRNDPDHSSLMMFGDGATATLLERTTYESIIATDLYADGSDYKMLCTLGGCRCVDAPREVSVWSDGKEHSLYDAGMDGVGVFFFASTKVPVAIQGFLEKNGQCFDDYDAVFLHQANIKIINQIIKKTKIPKEKVPISLDRFGNTSGCTIPLGIADYYGNVKDSVGQKLLLCGFGAGMSWGVASIELLPTDVFPIIVCDDIYEEGEIKPY